MKFNYPVPMFTLALAALLITPSVGHGQSILGGADDFVVLSGTAITVASPGPNTFANGDVGAITGISGLSGTNSEGNPVAYPPVYGTVPDGTIYLAQPVVTNALADLTLARTKLKNLAETTNFTATPTLGGRTLTAGVYNFDVAADLTGTLFLDANFQNNVTWVFNVGTSLTTAAGAQVVFINLGSNGGIDNGLFWNADAAINFGAENIIAGNYLAGTAITFGTTVVAEGSGSGRALAGAEVTFDGPASMDLLGSGGDLTGGLDINGNASGYVLLSGAGAYTAGISEVVLRPGVIYNTPNVIIDGDSANADPAVGATLTVFQTIATLTGENTYTGGTIVDAGQLTASSANLPTDGDVAFIDSNTTGVIGQLIFEQPADGVFGGVISGDGQVVKNDVGELTLTGENTYTGGTVINEGRLVASAAILPADQDIDIAADATLVLDEAAAASLGGIVSGPGTIEKQGVGALMLANDTDAALDLLAGSFVLTGNSVGATTLSSGAFLLGSGTVDGNLSNAGTVSPGLSPGVIVVAGNYTQTAGGTLVMEFASAASFDQLLVTGAAVLDGTLQIDLLNGYQPVDEDFIIITAGGGVSGVFTPVTGSAALTAELTYNANDVLVSFAQADFDIFAGTPNQIAVADAAQQSPELTTALNGVPLAAEIPAALNALSPQGYQVWSDIAFAHTASLGERLRHQPYAVEGEDDLYFEAGQSRGRLHGDLDVGSTRYTSESGLVGINRAIGPNLTVGAFFDYTETNSGMGSSGSRTEVESMMPGVRAAWRQGAWFANAIAGYGFDDYESTREINFTGTSATANSETKGRHWVLDVSGGRRFQAGPASISPFAGLQASGWKADGFTETGAGALNATVKSQSARSLRTQLGLEVAMDFTIGSAVVRPHVRGAWIHELENNHRSINAAFGAIDYSVETRDPQRDSARLSAGFDVALSPDVALYADYSIQTGHSTRVVGEWRAGLSIGF